LKQKKNWNGARKNLDKKAYADGIYNAYSAFVHAAKGLLLQQGSTVQYAKLVFSKILIFILPKTGLYTESNSFKETVLHMNESEPTEEFANSYLTTGKELCCLC
jgi:sulfite reductase (ferredoxin)